MYDVVWSPHFQRAFRRFRRSHPELKQRIERTLRDLRDDPFQEHLRLHPLHGELAGMHAVSITYRYRITLALKITEREIILLDIGDLAQVYRD